MTTTPPSAAPEVLREALREARLRVTTPRLAVLTSVSGHPHTDAATIFKNVVEELPGTSVQAVYNVLADLTGAGLLRRIEPAGSSALYERRTGDNHHHLVCSSCGRVEDVDCAVGRAPCLVPSQHHGFTLDQAEVTFWGTCPGCRDGRPDTPTTKE